MSRRTLILPACCFLALTTTLFSQQSSTGAQAGVATTMSGKPISDRPTGGASIQLSVVNEKKKSLDRPAAAGLSVENANSAPTWQETNQETSDATFTGLGLGKYDLQVSAVGYLTARKEITISNQYDPTHVQIVLIHDPDAIELQGSDPSLSGKAGKEAKKAVSDLQAGPFHYKDAQKHLDAAVKEAPNSSYVNFLYGYFYFQRNQGNDLSDAETYLTKATTADPHNVQALNLLARVHLVKKDPAGATTILQQSVAAAPDNATTHSILADAYVNQGKYKEALAEADLAISKGKSPTSSVNVVKGEALAHLGQDAEALKALNEYLQNVPDAPSAPQVKQLIAAIEQHQSSTPAGATPPQKQ